MRVCPVSSLHVRTRACSCVCVFQVLEFGCVGLLGWVRACVLFFGRSGFDLVEISISMRSSVGVFVGDRIHGWVVGWWAGSFIWSSI